MTERTVKVVEMNETERRIDAATAAVFEGTEFDRRKCSHDYVNVEAGCCRDCGRPMNETEARIYRAL